MGSRAPSSASSPCFRSAGLAVIDFSDPPAARIRYQLFPFALGEGSRGRSWRPTTSGTSGSRPRRGRHRRRDGTRSSQPVNAYRQLRGRIASASSRSSSRRSASARRSSRRSSRTFSPARRHGSAGAVRACRPPRSRLSARHADRLSRRLARNDARHERPAGVLADSGARPREPGLLTDWRDGDWTVHDGAPGRDTGSGRSACRRAAARLDSASTRNAAEAGWPALRARTTRPLAGLSDAGVEALARVGIGSAPPRLFIPAIPGGVDAGARRP